MADPANIEALQAQKAAEAQDAVDEQTIRRFCAVLQIPLPAPQPDDPAYRQLIQRLKEVITRELVAQKG